MKKKNIIFLTTLFLIFCIVIVTFFIRKNYYSVAENRNLVQIPQFSFESYFNAEYQEDLEKSLSDQFIGGELIKTHLYNLLNFSHNWSLKNKICKDNYFSLGGYYAIYDCNDSIVTYPQVVYPDSMRYIDNNINSFSMLNNYIDTYYYFISTPVIYNFINNTYSIDAKNIIMSKMTGDYIIDYLEFDDYSEYINYFYKNDHHWNHKGSYQGYKDIIEMLLPGESFISPIEEVEFKDTYFYGSSARMTRVYDFPEKFKAYKFNIPEYTVLYNRVLGTYGNQKSYFDGYYDKDIFAHHYSKFYGDTIAEGVFEFDNNSDKENLLILGNSFTNSISVLIASHFNKTYVVDLRYYEDDFGEKFDIKKYIERNNISKVLVVMDYIYLSSPDSYMEIGN